MTGYDFPALKAAEDELRKIFTEAGDDLNLDNVKCISGTKSGKLARIQELNTEVEHLQAVAKAAGRGVGRESGTEPGARDGRGHTGGLKGRQTLAKEHSVTDWLKANGHVQGEEQLSFDRYLKGIVTGDWAGAPRELKAMSEGTLTAGGHLVPTPLAGGIIDMARNDARVFQAGATLVPMTAQTLKVARLTGEGAPGWRNENSPITAADMTFDSVTFTARSLTRLITLSVELFEDADPSTEGIIGRSFASQIALELDRVATRGSGVAPEPRGILNTSGVTITTHGANGDTIANLKYGALVDAVGAVRNSNFNPNAQIEAVRTETALAKLADTQGQPLRQPQFLDGIPRLTTKQIPTNLTVGTSTDCSEVYTGQWSSLMIGIRTSFNIRFLSERFIDNGQYAFLAWLRADVQVAQPAAFVVDTGVRG